jgi:hypothetical protein
LKLYFYSFMLSVLPTWQAKKLVGRDQHKCHLQRSHTVMCGYRFWENKMFNLAVLCIM